MQILVKGASWSPNIGNVAYNGIKNFSVGEGTNNPLWLKAKEEGVATLPAIVLEQAANPRGNTYLRNFVSSYAKFSESGNACKFPAAAKADINVPAKSRYLTLGLWLNKTKFDAMKTLAGGTANFALLPYYDSSGITTSTVNSYDVIANDYVNQSVPLNTNDYVESVVMNSSKLATETISGQEWLFIQVKFEFTWKQAATTQKPQFLILYGGIGNALRNQGSGTMSMQIAGLVISDQDKELNPYIEYPFV